MSVLPITESDFNTQTDELKTQRADSISDFESFLNKAGHLDFGCLGDTWFSDVKERVDAAVIEMRELLAQFVEVSLEILSPGNPFWFYNASTQWREARSTLSSEQFSIVSARSTNLPSTESWHDDQVKWYAPMPDAQNATIDLMKSRCQSVENASLDHTKALTTGWVNLLTSFSALHSWVVTTVATFISADPMKWLDIVSQAVNCLVDLKDLIVGFVADMALAWSDARDLVARLQGDFVDNAALDGGKWPTIESFA
ncbi:hypothetical protein [Demequina aurantiaca]|uniref:hypothetical protein n=1 Tax=Demequina aurantiaca TaxID=676200 RepID=UPI003D3564F7